MRYIQPYDKPDEPNASYTNGNAGLGIKGSANDGRAFEHTMREIVNVITSGGLVPDEGDLTQLYTAIQALIAAYAVTTPDASTTVKGKIEIATAAEALGGTDTERALTSAGLASSKNLVSSGYYKFPGGLIFQWGNGTTSAGGGTWTFPIAFPNACLFASATQDASPTSNYVCGAMVTASKTTCNISSAYTAGPDGIYLFAIGH